MNTASSKVDPLELARPPTRWRRYRQRIAISLFLFFISGFLLLNAVAYFHGYRMTHFTASGVRTGKPEKLNLLQRATVLVAGVTIPKPPLKRTPAAKSLEFQTVKIQSPKNHATLELWVIPGENTTSTVLLFHGYASSKSGLVDEAAIFHELGYTCILTDFYGSGGSSRNDTSIGWFEADDVTAVLEYAHDFVSSGPAILYGKSMGAAAVLKAASVPDSKVAALILESPFDRMISTAANRFRTIGLPPFPFAHLITFWGGVQLGYPGRKHNPVESARQVSAPTLLMAGQKDTRVTPDQTKSIYNSLGSREASKLLWYNAGHTSFAHVDENRWKGEVRAFLDQHILLK